MRLHRLVAGAAGLLLSLHALAAPAAERSILNVSYDPTREFYKELNAAFAADWKAGKGEDATVIINNKAEGSAPLSVFELAGQIAGRRAAA